MPDKEVKNKRDKMAETTKGKKTDEVFLSYSSRMREGSSRSAGAGYRLNAAK